MNSFNIDTCPGFLQTGQTSCFTADGKETACPGSGQDGEYRLGCPWPSPRFLPQEATVSDLLTGLTWTRNANPAEFPMTWQEAFAFVTALNIQNYLGYNDWRLPNRKEMHSLMSYQAKKPSLPIGHPFRNIFLGWYWTSTTAARHPAYAWYIHLEGARMFYGRKDSRYLLWPVRGRSPVLVRTGQSQCYGMDGHMIQAENTGQDGELQSGRTWPQPRFSVNGPTVQDRLTKLCWLKDGGLAQGPVDWEKALAIIAELNKEQQGGINNWQLPNINALESLVDCSTHSPALPAKHPFTHVQDEYWSSTTSYFEPDWAWVLYLNKGALGVGIKYEKSFHVWPVAPAWTEPGI
jgi:hypothetical protein